MHLDGMSTDFSTLIRRAKLLSCETRVTIWNALGEEGRHPVALARELGLAPSTVSFHLSALVKGRLVTVYGHGASRVYRWSGVRLAILSEVELMAMTAKAATQSP